MEKLQNETKQIFVKRNTGSDKSKAIEVKEIDYHCKYGRKRHKSQEQNDDVEKSSKKTKILKEINILEDIGSSEQENEKEHPKVDKKRVVR